MSKLITLTRGYSAVVDDADYDLVSQYRWHVRIEKHSAYAGHNIKKPNGGYATQRMHTFLTGWPRVDHVDGDGLNNRRCNLRLASASENNRNARKHASAYSTYKGVSWCKRERRWFAQIQYQHKHKHLGYYSTEIDAALAYDAAAYDLFGQFALLNFPILAVVS